MSTSTITVGGSSVTLVSAPTTVALRAIAPMMSEAVGLVRSVFSGQAQAQAWPGAERWQWELTWPPLTSDQEDDVVAFLMQLQGMANAFQIGDPLRKTLKGSGAGTPLIDNTVANANAAMSPTLGLKGFTASHTKVLARGDYIQTGYRLYRALDNANSDGSGKLSVPVWPTLREQPVDASALIVSNTKGLWRLAKNQRGYSKDVTRLARMGAVTIEEYR